MRAIFGGWQLNVIATHNSGTPFTVSDSANVALQANSPPISGFPASRPNLVGDPNAGPHTVDEWLSRSAFERLNLQTQAGQFGNAGRNIARGPWLHQRRRVARARLSLPGEATRLQFRAEVFNVANHANFGLPVADLNSANFGRIFSAGPPRLMQFGVEADVLEPRVTRAVRHTGSVFPRYPWPYVASDGDEEHRVRAAILPLGPGYCTSASS